MGERQKPIARNKKKLSLTKSGAGMTKGWYCSTS